MRTRANIELLGMASPNAQKVAIMLGELSLKYDFKFARVHRTEHLTDAFLALNQPARCR